ncbi:TraB/GumN family protein [Paracoccus sp. KR1-242]|uniref:TraB/GumN family protein n=1 Tax=Paracoccus sp. KR1-242 TaxID=3410028 RepID=UPI003BFBEC14
MRLSRLLPALLIAAGLALPAAAECVGRNLLEALPSKSQAELRAAAERVPYHHGLFWQAVKGDQRITLIGTYHFDDPRHDLTLAQFGPDLDTAGALLVEAGPKEEARLADAMRSDPALIMDATGPTLPERMSEDDWEALWKAMEVRGIPAVVTSRMRPWYVSVLLSISPCMLKQVRQSGETGGLDHLLVQRAEKSGVPVKALEPWDTVFSLFDGMSPGEEIDMIRAAMPAAEYADDYAVTLTDAYFAGDSWLIWEFGRFDAYRNSGLSRAEVDRQVEFAQRTLMDQRNRHWIGPLEKTAAQAARQGKGIVAGFGALHLAGEGGVLSLLGKSGWTITQIKPQGGLANGG